ncbi:hypothetical protein M413DRAFT_448532 [Hebeloma cylindrosporum]|uniref:Uncharacterized protein n=1 Tax=Hebeloma cylindrosporum TaxID=76867 RepID=A0A0C3C1B3_HEBCY|nr:hypothetical protein M413DRAFT_448532 [Hebeloma cylindrosporum h7]
MAQEIVTQEPVRLPKDGANLAHKVSTDSCAFNHFPGFPRFVRNIRHFVAHQSYAHSLFAAGHGYPMYDTGTVSIVPKDYHSRGISIGDVGMLSDDGEFLFAFNIFLPSDHPYNEGKTPDSFAPLEPLDESEIHTMDEYFPRGAVIASKGIEITRHSENPLHLSFRSSERIGGLLVLPEGATRQDVSTDRIHKYIARNGQEWAYFFSQARWHPAINGSTYVVTGLDKTTDCSTMAFQVQLSESPRIRATYDRKALVAPDDISAVRNPIKPKIATTPPSRNLCVFLRGIRIGVGRAEWIENADGQPNNEEYATLYTELYYPPSWANIIKAKIALYLGFGRIGDRPSFSYFAHPFHPSDIIGPMMLSLRPDAPLVLIDDLIGFIDPNQTPLRKGPLEPRAPLTLSCSKGASFKDFRMMIEELFEFYDVVEQEGVLRLERNSKTSMEKVSGRRNIRHFFRPIYRNWASRGFTELVRKSQYHMDTNSSLPKLRRTL